MNPGKWRKPILYRLFPVLFLLLCIAIFSHRHGLLSKSRSYRIFAQRVKITLIKDLLHEHPLPPVTPGKDPNPSTIAYILGGGQNSLEYKIRTIGRLYREGEIRKVLALHNPGITEFDPGLGRNLTGDEWMLRTLEHEGVASADVELIEIPGSFFGTFGEGRDVSRIVVLRGFKRIVLVSSMHHMERVWITFSHFLRRRSFELYSYGSEEQAGLLELIAEYAKIALYRAMLFPADRLFRFGIDPPEDPRPGTKGSSCLTERFQHWKDYRHADTGPLGKDLQPGLRL